ncbi:flavin monoamine oxidase family protein [Paraglaciecola sp. 20A4]|uniref:flavin monoamine oxidase family protein n=1 Tax=Paraglaciecola sp. 20A4 TaxID=2687288 RepID=UPI00198147B5|nr:flavin monoamine oxidase family protein [Paraglaciecola sp. 20A4]
MKKTTITRRELLGWIGKTAGVAVMYQAMSSLSLAAESTFKPGFKLSQAPKGASILVLGAGVAGMTAAYELRKAGYKVRILEYNERAGGRCWTIRGGDSFTELGGETQHCKFEDGGYLNPGPWRIPYHHHGILHYCHEFGVKLEGFVQVNYNAMVHSTEAFGGKPKRYREVQADYQGHVGELLAKCVDQGSLDQSITPEDRLKLLESLRNWAGLDKSGIYRKSLESSLKRGFAVHAGGALMPKAVPSDPIDFSALLQSDLWKTIAQGQQTEHQTQIFQPVGGMDGVAKGFERQVKDLITYQAKVTQIDQDDKGIAVKFVDLSTGKEQSATADYCVCTIPLSVLSQIPVNVSGKMQQGIRSVPYNAAVKFGLQFKRRFWEQDEAIYGGISYTDQPIRNISYPSDNFGSKGKGVLLGGYMWGAPNAFEFTSMTPAERVKKAVEMGAKIHPQYLQEFDNGIAVGWHRVPWTHGCCGVWTPETRETHYDNLCQIDGRMVLAGEHLSYLNAWQEGAILSARDATERLHKHIISAEVAA